MVLQYRLRLYLVALILLSAFTGLLFRLWDVQITSQALYASQLSPTSKVTVRVPGVRGEIKDRNGETLVSNRLEYQLVLNLRVIVKDYDPAAHGRTERPKIARKTPRDDLRPNTKITDIATIVEETVIGPLKELGLEIDLGPVRHQIANHYDMTWPAGLVPYTLPLALTYDQFAMLSERSLEIPGLQPQAAPVRQYNYGSLACHTLGYVRKADRTKDLDDLKALALSDGPERDEAKRWLRNDHVYEPDPFGFSAIERSMDQYLKGRAGEREHLIDQKGVYVRDTRNELPQKGYDVRLTLDLRAQYIAEMALRKANDGKGIGRGAAVIIDPNNGGILAMASVPTFDPNKFIPAITREDFKRYRDDDSHPLISRATSAYAPGSTFKIATAFAGSLARSEGNKNVRNQYGCSGAITYGKNTRIKCMSILGRGTLGLQRAIMKSCNCYFYQYGNHAGIEQIKKVTTMMGLGTRLGLPISESSLLLVGDPAYLQARGKGERWTAANTAHISIGQGYVGTSPLQMANVAAIAANGGKYYRVRLVDGIEEGDGTRVEDFAPKVLFDLTEHGVTPETIDTVRLGMRDVVNATGGTARRARLDNVIVAGKTGTAQYTKNGETLNSAWFIAFAPFDKPQYALAVFVEDGKSGGKVAAPIAKRILQELFRGPSFARYRTLADAQGHFDTHEEISYDGGLWTVPEGEQDTADTVVSVNDPAVLGTLDTTNSEHKPQSSEVRERASIISPRESRER